MEARLIRGAVDSTLSGYGDGYGYGYGYGVGDDIARCTPSRVSVGAADLKRLNACSDQRRKFERVFPDGATWPDDIEKARAAGLDIEWARKNLGLLEPKMEAEGGIQ